MTFKMESSMEVTSDKDLGEVSVGEVNWSVPNNGGEADNIVRERNLLLLSALYYMYGEDWKQAPDWSKVGETIRSKKIPTFGDNFTAESCEQQYRSLLENGCRVGTGNVTTVLKPPKTFTEADKRIWMLAYTSTDLVRTSKILDTQIREMYATQLSQIDKISSGELDEKLEEIAKTMEPVNEVDSSSENEIDEEYEDPEVEKAAVDIAQMELLQEMVGLKDVLILIKYCSDAVSHAVDRLPAVVNRNKRRPSSTSEVSKSERIVEFTKSTISTNKVSQELTNLVHSAISGTSEDEKPKNAVPTAVAPTLSKLLEMPVTNPGQPLPEIPSVKQNEESQQRKSCSPSRGSSKERTPSGETKNNDSDLPVPHVPKDENVIPSTPKTSHPIVPTDVAEANGEDSGVESRAETDKTPSTTVELNEKTTSAASSSSNKSVSDKFTRTDNDNKIVPVESEDAKDVIKNTSSDPRQEDTVVESPAELIDTDTNERIPQNREPETAVKGKMSPRKNATTSSRSIPTRTSTRLTSPEPVSSDHPVTDDEKAAKKTVGRQVSSTESNTPVLRSRRGATPTKNVPVEKEQGKPNSVSADVLLSEENNIEKSDSTRTSPETTENKLDTDSNQDSKPKQLRVYSAKPPSPLSHVDPKLFAEFIDEEDDPELAMIDNNVNKSKEDKSSSKIRKGRTASSENTSDAGNNDESSNSKRLTRSSLKIHDAAHDGTAADESSENIQIGQGSEKAASESSFGGKEKKSRTSKHMLRLKKLNEEKQQLFGDGDSEEGKDGKRVTRARAKTGPAQPEKRTKLPSVGDSEGLSEPEPIPTRATRSRVSTASSNMPVLEPSASQQVNTVDDEDQKVFRKTAIIFLNKLQNHKSVVSFSKYLGDDPLKILKHPMDFQTIKRKIETGVSRTYSSIHKDLCLLITNLLLAHPNVPQLNEFTSEFYACIKSSWDEVRGQRLSSAPKGDDSDAESLESHEEHRSDSASKQPAGNRRKRKRSASETSVEEVFPQENKRRVTRTSTSSAYNQGNRKTKHPISPDIVSANRVRH